MRTSQTRLTDTVSSFESKFESQASSTLATSLGAPLGASASMGASLSRSLGASGGQNLSQKAVRKRGLRHLAPMPWERKASQQAALAFDQKFVQQTLEEYQERPQERLAREEAFGNMRLAAVFHPVPQPRDLMPQLLLRHPPLIRDSAPSQPRRRKRELVGLEDEAEAIIELCSLCAEMLSEQVLSRPAFCRVLCALEGLSPEPGAWPLYHNAVQLFDSRAELLDGTVGLALQASGPGDMPLIELFSALVVQMSEGLCPDLPQHERLELAQERLAALLPQAKRALLLQSEALRQLALELEAAPSQGSSATSAVPSYAPSLPSSALQTPREPLKARTFAVLKGELLASQLLEPDVLQLVYAFRSSFAQLFGLYCDIPLVGDRHMSFTALLRFFHDTGLFPAHVDFQTLRWLYDNAELTSPLPETSRSPVKREKKRRPERPEPGSPVFWEGRWIRQEVAWMIKSDPSEREEAARQLVHALEDWLSDRGMTAREFFADAQRVEGRLRITAEELAAAARFMGFQPPEAALPVLAGEFSMLEHALQLARHQKRGRSKPLLTVVGTQIYSELLLVMERRLWRQEDLLQLLPEKAELEDLAARVSQLTGSPVDPSALALEGVDGTLSRADIERALEWVRDQQEARRRRDATSHPLLRAAGPATRPPRLFGVAAFAEVILKASISHLSYHGSADQAQQSSFVKALWLMVFVRWQLQEKTLRSKSRSAGPLCYRNPIQRLSASGLIPFQHADMPEMPESKSFWGSKVDELLHHVLQAQPPSEAVGKHLFASALAHSAEPAHA